jgi:hypothetical protein
MSSALVSVPAHQLLARLHALARRANAVEADLLAHLGEVDARRLFLEQACPSMFVYCQRVLHFAEGVAYKRIHAARAVRRFPQLLQAVRRGELHLTGVSLLAPNITAENCSELIAAAKHRSADEIRRLLADRQPRPDVAAAIRRVSAQRDSESVAAGGVPERRPSLDVPEADVECNRVSGSRGESVRGPVVHVSAAPHTPASDAPVRSAHSEPLGGERYCVRFTADRELHDQLQELRALMRHQVPDGDLGKILARAVALLLEQVRKRKFAESAAPRPAKPSSDRPTRQIPAAVRRAVARRDGERCTYVSRRGERCGARDFLEFHHHDPWARNRLHSVEGISLRCRAHNQHAACRDFGDRHMARFRGRQGHPMDPVGEGPNRVDCGGRFEPDPDQVRGEGRGEGVKRGFDAGTGTAMEPPPEQV